MALTAYAKIEEAGLSPSDPNPILVISFTGDSSYPIGGYTAFSTFVATNTARSTNVVAVTGFGDKSGTSYTVQYDAANDTLKVRAGATGIELADTTDLSTVAFVVTVWSK